MNTQETHWARKKATRGKQVATCLLSTFSPSFIFYSFWSAYTPDIQPSNSLSTFCRERKKVVCLLTNLLEGFLLSSSSPFSLHKKGKIHTYQQKKKHQWEKTSKRIQKAYTAHTIIRAYVLHWLLTQQKGKGKVKNWTDGNIQYSHFFSSHSTFFPVCYFPDFSFFSLSLSSQQTLRWREGPFSLTGLWCSWCNTLDIYLISFCPEVYKNRGKCKKNEKKKTLSIRYHHRFCTKGMFFALIMLVCESECKYALAFFSSSGMVALSHRRGDPIYYSQPSGYGAQKRDREKSTTFTTYHGVLHTNTCGSYKQLHTYTRFSFFFSLPTRLVEREKEKNSWNPLEK